MSALMNGRVPYMMKYINENFWSLIMLDKKSLKPFLSLKTTSFVVSASILVIILFDMLYVFPKIDMCTMLKENYGVKETSNLYFILNTKFYVTCVAMIYVLYCFLMIFIYFLLYEIIQYKMLAYQISLITKDLDFVPEFERYRSQFYQKVVRERLNGCVKHHMVLLE